MMSNSGGSRNGSRPIFDKDSISNLNRFLRMGLDTMPQNVSVFDIGEFCGPSSHGGISENSNSNFSFASEGGGDSLTKILPKIPREPWQGGYNTGVKKEGSSTPRRPSKRRSTSPRLTGRSSVGFPPFAPAQSPGAGGFFSPGPQLMPSSSPSTVGGNRGRRGSAMPPPSPSGSLVPSSSSRAGFVPPSPSSGLCCLSLKTIPRKSETFRMHFAYCFHQCHWFLITK